jgi:hypothetical protein
MFPQEPIVESSSPSSGRSIYRTRGALSPSQPAQPADPPGSDAAAPPAGESAAVAMALWCPHCKTPFVGRLSTSDGTFVHAGCGGRSEVDLELLDDLAAESWFWRRYRDRLRGGPEGNRAD